MTPEEKQKLKQYESAFRKFRRNTPDIEDYLDLMNTIVKTDPPINQHTRDPYEVIEEVYLRAKAIMLQDEWEETYEWINDLEEVNCD